MCVIYFFAGISKLQGEAWWTGEAMWRAFSNLEYQSIDMTWLAWYPWLLNLVTHLSVLWGIFFCVLIWRPRLRPLMLAGAVVLHVGIGACLGMWTFGLIMLSAAPRSCPIRPCATLWRSVPRPVQARGSPHAVSHSCSAGRSLAQPLGSAGAGTALEWGVVCHSQ